MAAQPILRLISHNNEIEQNFEHLANNDNTAKTNSILRYGTNVGIGIGTIATNACTGTFDTSN